MEKSTWPVLRSAGDSWCRATARYPAASRPLRRSEAEFGGEVFRIIEADEIGINQDFKADTFDGERLRTGELDV